MKGQWLQGVCAATAFANLAHYSLAESVAFIVVGGAGAIAGAVGLGMWLAGRSR